MDSSKAIRASDVDAAFKTSSQALLGSRHKASEAKQTPMAVAQGDDVMKMLPSFQAAAPSGLKEYPDARKARGFDDDVGAAKDDDESSFSNGEAEEENDKSQAEILADLCGTVVPKALAKHVKDDNKGNARAPSASFSPVRSSGLLPASNEKMAKLEQEEQALKPGQKAHGGGGRPRPVCS